MIFKSIDQKFSDIGFDKVSENKYGAMYERFIDGFGYTHSLHIASKHNKSYTGYVVLSYQKYCNSDDFNNCCSLTEYEAKLVCKKIRSIKIASIIDKVKTFMKNNV